MAAQRAFQANCGVLWLQFSQDRKFLYLMHLTSLLAHVASLRGPAQKIVADDFLGAPVHKVHALGHCTNASAEWIFTE